MLNDSFASTAQSEDNNITIDYDFFEDDESKITNTGASPLLVPHTSDPKDTTYSVSITPSCRLILAHDALLGTGGLLWPAGELLARYLLNPTPSFDPIHFLGGKKVVELGSGTGVVGLSCAHAQARVQASGPGCGGTVTLTDLPQVLPILRRNVSLNELGGTVSVHELSWGAKGLDHHHHHELMDCDVVLAADCIYLEHLFQPLLDTLVQLMLKQTAVAYLSYKKRRKADARFFKLLRKSFIVEEVDVAPEVAPTGTDVGGIHLYRVVRKYR